MKNLCIIFIFILLMTALISCIINSENTENEPNNSIAQANHILLDADDGITASIDPADDADFFFFDSYTGESFEITAECLSSSLDLVISIFNESENLLDTVDLTSIAGDEIMSYDAIADGTLYIRITSSGSLSTGDYIVSANTTQGK
jgi:hypothetical protein